MYWKRGSPTADFAGGALRSVNPLLSASKKRSPRAVPVTALDQIVSVPEPLKFAMPSTMDSAAWRGVGGTVDQTCHE